MRRVLMAGIVLATLFAGAATVSDVSARQRWPWNNLVDIDYTLDGDASDLSVRITVTDRTTGQTYTPSTFSETPPTIAGTHRVTWDSLADGVSVVSTAMVATVSLVYMPIQPSADSTYLVIDLSGGTNTVFYPVSYLSAIPSGGWTDAYKTTKLVLRRVPAGTFTMGSPVDELGCRSGETQHEVTIAKPFYIGVFEVTQLQWELVTGTRPSYFSNSSCYATRPVERVSYDDIRGSSAGAGWPSSSAVDATSFLGRLRAKTGLDGFDLPTEAQWEYVCRAGTTTALNSGKNLADTDSDANMDAVGRYRYNGGSGSGTAAVGSYTPNAWGLYDMHGNVLEWCLDWYGSLSSTVAVAPVGSASGSCRVRRGGGWNGYACICRSAYRGYDSPSGGSSDGGFRLCCSVGLR